MSNTKPSTGWQSAQYTSLVTGSRGASASRCCSSSTDPLGDDDDDDDDDDDPRVRSRRSAASASLPSRARRAMQRELDAAWGTDRRKPRNPFPT